MPVGPGAGCKTARRKNSKGWEEKISLKRRLKPDQICRELEDAAGKLFHDVRRETGAFGTGVCTLKDRQILFINIRQPVDERIAALARAISTRNTDNLFLKPVVRAEVERYTQRGTESTSEP